MATLSHQCEPIPKNTGESDPGHVGCILRQAFTGQARLLALRAESGLPLDIRSVRNLLRLYRQLMLKEMA